MPFYEVTAAGFDGGTDATDDRVLWVEASSKKIVTEAIAGTGAKVWDELPEHLQTGKAVDYRLDDPDQLQAFKQKLEEFRDNLPAQPEDEGEPRAKTLLNALYTDLLMAADGTWVPDEHSCQDSLTNLEELAKLLGYDLGDTRDA